jgi:hypothetical protein
VSFPSGDLVVAGSAVNGLDLGAGAMTDFTAYVAVLSPTGQLRWVRSGGRWIKQATNTQIARFLRDVRMPALAVRTMRALLHAQKMDGYA